MDKAHGYVVFPQTPRVCGGYGMHAVAMECGQKACIVLYELQYLLSDVVMGVFCIVR